MGLGRAIMNYQDLAQLLSDIDQRSLFLRFNPEVFDFTDKEAECELQFFVQGGKEFQVRLTGDTLPMILSLLKLSVFSKGMKVFVWNWKCFISYVIAKTNNLFNIDCSIIDIKIIESYNGIKKQCPVSFIEAFNRVKNLVSSGGYKNAEKIYKQIHMPLMTTVIPSLESIGIIDTDRKAKVHAYYEIDGQDNGRLRCHNAFKRGYVPHTMSSEVKAFLKPISYDDVFMSFDFRGMEVFVLAHLSQDQKLIKFCKEPDIYGSLHKELLGSDGKNNRELAKKCFLPVIYGQSAYSLSQRCGLAIDVAEQVVERISSSFSASCSFVAKYENDLKKNGFVQDVFGKRRYNFEQGKEYLAKNFSIQSPAATICLEKLINLYFVLKDKAKIAYTVHDGYTVYVNKNNWKQIYKNCMEILTSESDLCKGLHLKVSCRGGRNLNDLKSISQGENNDRNCT